MDITKCDGKGCPIKERCKRYTTRAHDLWQSFFTYPPFTIDKGKFTCEYFWGEPEHYLLEQLKSTLPKIK
jgi:hypothetical protein